MKKFWGKNKKVIILLIVWRFILFLIEKIAPFVMPQHPGYNGPIPWANHDGLYYLLIAQMGYRQFTEAFFPLYPLMIFGISQVSPLSPWINATILSYSSFFVGTLLFYNALYQENKSQAWWSVFFLIIFPASFFFCAVYTEGLFFLFTILVFVFVKKKQWFWAGIFGALASATRLFGVLLFVYAIIEYISSQKGHIRLRDVLSICLIPVGLFIYMGYLYRESGDPFLFFHIQPLFGANRSGSSLILLPQVVWRYIKMLFTAYLQPTPASYFITVIELVTTCFGYGVLIYGYLKKEKISYLIYGLLAITLPTLTGTFSSMPRYLLSIFPIFILLGKIKSNSVKYGLVVVFSVLQIIISVMFARGWFVA